MRILKAREPSFLESLFKETTMRDSSNHWKGVIAVLVLLSFTHRLPAADAPSKESKPIRLRVLVAPTASLWVEGARTQQTGAERLFESPPVEPGKTYVYTLVVSWIENGKEIAHTRTVKVKAGDEPTVDLRPEKLPKLDVIYVPTPDNVVDRMLDMAKVTRNDFLFDLGCGDGRIVIAAAKKHGARGVGIDIDPARIAEANENARKAGVQDLVEFRQGDIFKKIDDLNKATVVTLYLYPDLNLRLRPVLQKTLKPGSRIVSHNYGMKDWKPIQSVKLHGDDGDDHEVFLWKIPDDKKEEQPKPKKDKKPEKDEKP
jgi:uncharacterized protein (TIGR03000 family)